MNTIRWMRRGLQNRLRRWFERDTVEPLGCSCAAAEHIPGLTRNLHELLVALDTDEQRLLKSELQALRERDACRTIVRQLEERNAALEATVDEMKKYSTSEDPPRFGHWGF